MLRFRNFFCLSFLLTAFFLCGTMGSQAQEALMQTPPISFETGMVSETSLELDNSSDVLLVATVNIYDAMIRSQEGRRIDVAFTLSNRENVQPDITYGVRLFRLSSAGEMLYTAGTFPAKERVALGVNENLSRTFSLNVPEYLPGGNYTVEVWASNSSGINLAFAQAGSVMFGGGVGV